MTIPWWGFAVAGLSGGLIYWAADRFGASVYRWIRRKPPPPSLSIWEMHCLHSLPRRDCQRAESKARASKGFPGLAEVMERGLDERTQLVPTCCKCGGQNWRDEKRDEDMCPGNAGAEKAIDELTGAKP